MALGSHWHVNRLVIWKLGNIAVFLAATGQCLWGALGWDQTHHLQMPSTSLMCESVECRALVSKNGINNIMIPKQEYL